MELRGEHRGAVEQYGSRPLQHRPRPRLVTVVELRSADHGGTQHERNEVSALDHRIELTPRRSAGSGRADHDCHGRRVLRPGVHCAGRDDGHRSSSQPVRRCESSFAAPDGAVGTTGQQFRVCLDLLPHAQQGASRHHRQLLQLSLDSGICLSRNTGVDDQRRQRYDGGAVVLRHRKRRSERCEWNEQLGDDGSVDQPEFQRELESTVDELSA